MSLGRCKLPTVSEWMLRLIKGPPCIAAAAAAAEKSARRPLSDHTKILIMYHPNRVVIAYIISLFTHLKYIIVCVNGK